MHLSTVYLLLFYCFLSDKGPIRTSVIVAPATSPKQQEIIEIVDSQDTSANSLPSFHPSQAVQNLVSRSPTSAPVTTKQTAQPLRAGDAEQQSNPAARNSEQVIQLDKQSWDQLPPLYKYMIQMRVIEEQQQLQMAQQMQGQQRQQQVKPPPPPPQQQQPPVSSHLQPNFLQNLALQTQMFSIFQAQLANQNLLPQIAGKFPLVATTAAAIPIVTTAGVIPSFPANFMVTGATSGSATAQEANVATSTSNVSMETSSSVSEPSTSVVNSNSRSHDNKKHQRNEKISDTTSYRVNQTPGSPEETTSDDSGKIAGIEPFVSSISHKAVYWYMFIMSVCAYTCVWYICHAPVCVCICIQFEVWTVFGIQEVHFYIHSII